MALHCGQAFPRISALITYEVGERPHPRAAAAGAKSNFGAPRTDFSAIGVPVSAYFVDGRGMHARNGPLRFPRRPHKLHQALSDELGHVLPHTAF